MNFNNFDHCIPCISADGTTEYLANCRYPNICHNHADADPNI